MRVAILLHKADSEGVTMPEEVAFFIAKHLRSNVRELEGALRKVSAYARFHGREVLTVDVCKDALKDLLSRSEVRSVGKGGVSACRSRWSRSPEKKQKHTY